MKQRIVFCLLLFTTISNDNFSQTISSRKGLTTIVFANPQGLIKIYLPDDIRPGDMISGSIMLSPVGNSVRQKQKAMDGLLKTKLHIGDPSDPGIVAKQLTGLYPDKITALVRMTGSLPFVVSITDGQNKMSSATIPPAGVQNNNSTSGCSFPTHALTGSHIPVNGPFDGDASNTKCDLDNEPVDVIAESPRKCIVQYPESAAANPIISIQENKQAKCSQQINTVKMNISAGRLNLLKGEKTIIDVMITGLEGLKEPATLTIENWTKEVVILEGGDKQVTVFAPGVTDSMFKKQWNVQSIQSGSFSVNINLELPGNSPPIFADIKDAKGGKRDEGVLTSGTKTALEIGMKKWADANTEGRNPVDWDCPNCFQCIKTITFAANAGQVGTLGWGIITSFLSGGVKLAGGLLNKVKDIADKGGDIYKAIQELIDAGEIQVVGFNEQWCANNTYCQVTGMIVYDVKTGCVEGTYRCRASKLCCPFAETYYTIKYCLDKDGAVIADTVSMSISH